MVRAKFRVSSYETFLDRGEELRSIKFNVVVDGSPENKEFFKWTPSGQIQLGTLNRKAWEQFPLGSEMYVDFTPAAKEAPDVRGTT
jgi:hypothetical protein